MIQLLSKVSENISSHYDDNFLAANATSSTAVRWPLPDYQSMVHQEVHEAPLYLELLVYLRILPIALKLLVDSEVDYEAHRNSDYLWGLSRISAGSHRTHITCWNYPAKQGG